MPRLPCVLSVAILLGGAAVGQQVPPQSPVPGLRELLRVDDVGVRITAAEGLAGVGEGVVGLPAQAAVVDLLRVFEDDPDRGVATMAAEALAVLSPWPLGTFEFLSLRLEAWAARGADPDAIERARVVLRQPERRWLGTTLAPLLLRVAKSPACARGALGALALLGEDGGAATTDLLSLLAGTGPKERWRVAFALACVGGEAAGALPEGVDADDADCHLWLLRARCRREPPSAALAALVSPWLSHERAPVRRWAVATAATFGPAFAPEIETVLELFGQPSRRFEAMQLLFAMGPQAAPAVPPLLARLRQPSPEDAFEWVGIFELLRRIGPGAAAATEALLAFAEAQRPADPLAAQLVERRAEAAVGALAAIAPERAASVLWPGVAEAPPSEDPGTWHGVHRFACLGPAAAAVLPQLRALLAANDRLASARALLVLSRVGPAAAPIAPDLGRWLRSDDAYVRWLALQVAWSMGAQAASLLPELTALFDRTSGNHRTDAMREAGRLGPGAEPLLLRALRSDESWTRRIAAEQLLRAAWLSAAARASVLSCLDGDDAELRQHVFDQLCILPAHAATADAQARRLLGTTLDPHLRQACEQRAWQALLLPVPEFPRLEWWLLDDSALHAAFFAGLDVTQRRASLAAPASLASAVLAFAAVDDAAVRRGVAVTLARLPTSAASWRVLTELTTDHDAWVRRAALTAIGWQGKAAGGAVAVLGRALRDPDWHVRAAAMQALRCVLHPSATLPR